MYTFITMRALAASPLMMGGDLPTLDKFSLSLITNKEMLACNQNGVMGKLTYDKAKIEVWNTAQKDGKGGWIGIFNRNNEVKTVSLNYSDVGVGLDKTSKLVDIWNKKRIKNLNFTINAHGVVFIKY